MQQLPLQLQPKEGCTFASFFPASNQLIIDVIASMLTDSGENQVFIWGVRGIGKSHLLQALCHQASRVHKTISYLPLVEMMDMGAEVLEGVEQLELLAIDDVQAVAGNAAWETGLFNLINRCRLSGTRILFAAQGNPGDLGIQLPDLVSRLSWGPVFQVTEMNDAEKTAALQFRARQRGIELADNVIAYLMQHFPRDLFALFDYLDTLDQASLAQQRRITIPFLKSVLAG